MDDNDLKLYFDQIEFVTDGITVSPSSRESFKHACYKKFQYYKVMKVQVPKINFPWLRDGSAIHRVIEVYYNRINYAIFGELLKDISTNKIEIIKMIVKACISIIPAEYKEFVKENYFDHFVNFAVFEFDRMSRIDAVYDLKDKINFDKYYKPIAKELVQNQYAIDRGISYRLDVLYLLPIGYLDNNHEISCIGDFKTGGGSRSIFYKVSKLKAEIKEQLVFPVPYLILGKTVKYPIEAVVGCYTKVQNAFCYENITKDDFLILYNDLNDIKKALKVNSFPRTYKWCQYCEYKQRCLIDEGLTNRINYKLGFKRGTVK